MSKISLIVPVYNSQKYIKKCLKSLINQTLTEIEIIIINDGSNDNSEKIVKNFTDKRIKYFKQKNRGIGYSRNLGIKKAKGDFIGFVDSDDYVKNNFCEEMYNKAISEDFDVVVCNMLKEQKNELLEFVIPDFKETKLEKDPSILNKINFGPCNKIYKKSTLIKNNILFAENLKYEDFSFVAKVLLTANKIGKIDDFLSYYVIHSNSETTIMDEKVFDLFKVIDIAKVDYMKNNKVKYNFKSLICSIITDYTIQQRNQKSKAIRNKFIDVAFLYLNENYESWKKDRMFSKISFIKRLIKRNKKMTKIYCSIYFNVMSIISKWS